MSRLSRKVTKVPPTLAPIITTTEPAKESMPTSTKPMAKDVATVLPWATAESRTPKRKARGFFRVNRTMRSLDLPPKLEPKAAVVSSTP
jgi:hypothetical protein